MAKPRHLLWHSVCMLLHSGRTLNVSVRCMALKCGADSLSSADVWLPESSVALRTATGLLSQAPAADTNLPPMLLLANSPARQQSPR